MWEAVPEWSASHIAAMGMVSMEVERNISTYLMHGNLQLCSIILLGGDYGHFWGVCRSGSTWLEVDVATRGAHRQITADAVQKWVCASLGIWVIYVRI